MSYSAKIVKYGIRVLYIIGASIAVFFIIKQPWEDYSTKKASILTETLEPETEFYPSVTICTGNRDGGNHDDILQLLEEQERRGILTTSPQDITNLIAQESFSYRLPEAVLGLYQTYGSNCDRQNSINTNLLLDEALWKSFLPHPKFSGMCYSYNPVKRSQPGECYSLRIGFGPSGNSPWVKDQMLRTDIFLHTTGKFQYYKEDDMPNNYKVDTLALKEEEETTIKLSKTFFTALDKPDKGQPCVSGKEYIWSECLDGLFYAERGCQDPWNYYQAIPLPFCSNISKIIGDYRQGSYTSCQMTCWDKPYMSQRSLSETSRLGKTCPLPCSREIYKTKISYKPKRFVSRYEYGAGNWTYALKILYQNFLQEKSDEFFICESSCLLAQVGGTLGIFFGISILQLIFGVEWFLSIGLNKCFRKEK